MSENIITLDCETFLVGDDKQPPQVVCVSFCDRNGTKGLLHFDDAEPVLRAILEDHDTYICGHNVAFDMSAILTSYPSLRSLVVDAYDRDRVIDTWWNDMLWDIEEGKFRKLSGGRWGKFKDSRFYQYNLADLAHYHLGVHVEKEDTWRLHYDQLFGIPLDQWPEDAKEYAINDAVVTMEILETRGAHHGVLHETKAAWFCHWLGVFGIKVDPARVDALEASLLEEYEGLRDEMEAQGFGRWTGPKKEPRRKFTRTLEAIRAAVTEAYNGDPPLTDVGNVSMAADTVEQAPNPGPLGVVPKYVSNEKLRSTYVKAMRGVGSDGRVHAYFNPLVETHRTSCRGPNLQNPPKKNGVRECFVPEEGNIFVGCDYSALEMCTLAQVCLVLFGESKLADAINGGMDTHLYVVSNLLGLSYEEVKRRYDAGDPQVKELRVLAKPANFGFAGGMSPTTLPDYARGMGITVTLDQAHTLYEGWMGAWEEMSGYFDWIKSQVGPEGRGPITNPITGRIRYASFTEGANFPFQGLAAWGAKIAGHEIVRCCLDPEIPAFPQTVPVLFVHDEFVVECPEELGPSVAMDLKHAMIDGMEKACPDVKISAEPYLMRCWKKDAEAVYDEDGKLQPWEG